MVRAGSRYGRGTIWSTHFVAMLGYRPGLPVELDPALTSLSLLVAMAGASLALLTAMLSRWRLAPAYGGGLFGLSISAMHYLGMLAYRVQGVVIWDMTHVIASILLAVGLGALAFHLAHRRGGGCCRQWCSAWPRFRCTSPAWPALAFHRCCWGMS